MTPHRPPIICPHCRKLISGDEPVCPYCHVRRPGSWWQRLLVQAGNGPDRLVPVIIGINVVMYLLSLMISPRGIGMTGNPLNMLAPNSLSLVLLGGTGQEIVGHYGRWWSLVTAGYLHGSLMHLLFNMVALYQIGPLVVREYGLYRFVIIYSVGSVAGFVVSVLAGIPLTIGASAGLCALLGAAIYFGKSRGGVYGQAVFKQIGSWAIMILVFGFLVPGINNWAHGGGMAAGAALGLALGYQERGVETSWQRLAAQVCIGGTLVLLVWAVGSTLLQRIA